MLSMGLFFFISKTTTTVKDNMILQQQCSHASICMLCLVLFFLHSLNCPRRELIGKHNKMHTVVSNQPNKRPIAKARLSVN